MEPRRSRAHGLPPLARPLTPGRPESAPTGSLNATANVRRNETRRLTSTFRRAAAKRAQRFGNFPGSAADRIDELAKGKVFQL